ncbi:hypothetical protein pb186bvf_014153 [Paramecium bursaria]
MEPTSIYIRVKRENRIFFFVLKITDQIESIKRKLTGYYKQDLPDMRLYLGDRLLDDKANLQDQTVRNDSIIVLKLRKQTLEWEE